MLAMVDGLRVSWDVLKTKKVQVVREVENELVCGALDKHTNTPLHPKISKL
jgi:hypothetical protein